MIYQKIIRAIQDGALIERIWIKMRPYLSWPYRLLTLPLRRRSQMHWENFHQAILDPKNPYSAWWASHYLKHLDFRPGQIALDFGCGRGRNIAHLRAAGFKVYGIDIARHEYWRNFAEVVFEIIKPGSRALPCKDQTFDLILVSGVLGFFDRAGIEALFGELERVLRPDGSIVLIESNIQSHAGRTMRAYFGRTPETVEAIKAIASARFRIIDQWFESYYAKWFPITRNLIYDARQKTIGNWMIVDPRSDELKPERRGLCVMVLTTPYG